MCIRDRTSMCTTRLGFAGQLTKMGRQLGQGTAPSIGAMPLRRAARHYSHSAWRRMGGWGKTRNPFSR
eukprot:8031080-Prorocentrum_lima.AAC.1